MIGKVGENSIASTKDIKANSFTFGFDKVMENLGIKGLAFRIEVTMLMLALKVVT